MPKVKIEIEINDCTDCVFKKDQYGHGECWSYCSNPNHKQKPYENILWGCQEKFETVPEWCPIDFDV